MDSVVIFRGALPAVGGGNHPLTPEALSCAAARVGKMLGFGGTTMCLPLEPGRVALAVSNASGERELATLVKHTACELECEIFTDASCSEPFTLGDDDCDLSFLDRLPAQEEEVGAIRLRFSIDRPRVQVTPERLARFCRDRGYDCEPEPDGVTVYISTTVALDLFFDESSAFIDGELDATYAGAGLLADSCTFARELAAATGGRLTFLDPDKMPYPQDGDFDALQQRFYEAMRQQLAFAAADDRDGMQAYIGWSVDTYEPEDLPGTVITHLGRYELDRLFDEIRTYGFEAVADRRFMIRNVRNKSSDESVKSALSLLWGQCSSARYRLRPKHESFIPERFALERLEAALTEDACPQLPLDEYMELCTALSRTPTTAKSFTLFRPHFEIGYLKSDINYGFGSYLRRVKLPGALCPSELEVGRHIVFTDGGRVKIEVKIEYGSENLSPRDGYFGESDDVLVFDIGGNSVCLAQLTEEQSGIYRARAEIVIRDERITIELESGDAEWLERFEEMIEGSKAVEEVDDLPPAHPGEKPRAFGACYYLRGEGDNADMTALAKKLASELEPTRRLTNQITLIHGPATLTNSKLGGKGYMPDKCKAPTVPRELGTLADRSAGKPMELVLQLNFDDFEPLPSYPERGILQLWVYQPRKREYDEALLRGQTHFAVRWYPEPEESLEVAEKDATLILATRSAMPISPEDRRFDELSESARGLAARLMNGAPELFEKHFCKPGSRIGGYRTLASSDECYENAGELVCQIELEGLRFALMLDARDFADWSFERAMLYIDNLDDGARK